MRLLLVVLPFLLGASSAAHAADDLGAVADFSLTDQDNQTITRADLAGKTWVASFLLARCPDYKCPQVAATVKRMHQQFAGRRDVVFVTFVLDEDLASAAPLKQYADQQEAEPGRWYFLFGDRAALNAVRRSFHLVGDKTKDSDHDDRLFVVDRHGRWRAWVDGPTLQASFKGLPPQLGADAAEQEMFARDQRRLRKHLETLAQPELPAWMPRDFPAFNATLNALAGALALLGYAAIRQRWTRTHIVCMVTALVVSALFLTSYLFYHLYVKGGRPTRFSEQAPDAAAWVGYLYAFILGSHTILAVPVAPLAVWIAIQGARGQLVKHVNLARWVLPMWVYVSVTGVVVYAMLYRLYPG